MDDDRNSSVVFIITPVGFDFSELASRGYKIRIDVEYDFYYKKDYDIPFDIGYMGSPKYEVSIFNSDKIGQFKSDLSTKSAIQTRTISCETAAANYENTIIYLQFSTDNIQNIIYFKNIVVSVVGLLAIESVSQSMTAQIFNSSSNNKFRIFKSKCASTCFGCLHGCSTVRSCILFTKRSLFGISSTFIRCN